ncbi:MAG: cytochrome c peroxidase [Bacteroidota bacterium]
MKGLWYSVLGLLMLLACEKSSDSKEVIYPALMEVPAGFPEVLAPDGNAFTQERWQLGKRLFFDPAMSVDATVSCASCHEPALAFSDGRVTSIGVEDRVGRRNSPSLANIAYHPYFTREGGVPTLEAQVFVPIQEHDEFNYNMVLLSERLQTDSTYVQMAEAAYGRTMDPFVITRSIACFERSLLSGNSTYDQYVQGAEDAQLSPAALRGMELFFSEQAKCGTCHGGFNFTDYSFANNGLYEEYDDVGRFRLTNKEEDLGLFKVPSLRNVEYTAPYMHDGSFSSLEAVVAHYNSGGFAHPNKNDRIQPLGLSEQEMQDLVAFLKSLTDETFIENPLFRKEP